MPQHTLLFAFLYVTNLIGDGIGLPVGDAINSTISREFKERTVRFPTDSATQRKSSEWPIMYTHSNLSRDVSLEEIPFIFPEDNTTKPRFVPNISKRSPACAKGTTFCESIDDYPQDYLQNVLSNKVDEFQPFLGVDIVKEPQISHKIDGVDENPLCASVEQVVYPKTAKTKEDKWLYVVNQPPYNQGVRIEKCLKSSDSSNQACSFTDQFPLGYKTSCKQKYIFRKMVALDEDGKPITDIFQLPSCCACTVKHDSLKARFGGGRLPITPATSPKPNDEK